MKEFKRLIYGYWLQDKNYIYIYICIYIHTQIRSCNKGIFTLESTEIYDKVENKT